MSRIRAEFGGATLQVILEEHSTGDKSSLELREFAEGYRWMRGDTILTDLEPRPRPALAVLYLEQIVKETHIISKQNTRKSKTRNVGFGMDPELSFEVGTLAALHGITIGQFVRRIVLDYIRQGSPAPLPRLTKEYIQTLLKPYKQGTYTAVTHYSRICRNANIKKPDKV
jgi:hypothetical protein